MTQCQLKADSPEAKALKEIAERAKEAAAAAKAIMDAAGS